VDFAGDLDGIKGSGDQAFPGAHFGPFGNEDDSDRLHYLYRSGQLGLVASLDRLGGTPQVVSPISEPMVFSIGFRIDRYRRTVRQFSEPSAGLPQIKIVVGMRLLDRSEDWRPPS
jgi:hypothetical protein